MTWDVGISDKGTWDKGTWDERIWDKVTRYERTWDEGIFGQAELPKADSRFY